MLSSAHINKCHSVLQLKWAAKMCHKSGGICVKSHWTEALKNGEMVKGCCDKTSVTFSSAFDVEMRQKKSGSWRLKKSCHLSFSEDVSTFPGRHRKKTFRETSQSVPQVVDHKRASDCVSGLVLKLL